MYLGRLCQKNDVYLAFINNYQSSDESLLLYCMVKRADPSGGMFASRYRYRLTGVIPSIWDQMQSYGFYEMRMLKCVMQYGMHSRCMHKQMALMLLMSAINVSCLS